MAEYQPGVCNIGVAERRKRSALGVAASLGTLALVLVVLTTDTSRLALATSVFPLFLVAEGVLQAQTGFCPRFAADNAYDVSDDGTNRQTVADPQHREVDRRRARKLHLQSAAVAVGGAVLLVVVGLLVP